MGLVLRARQESLDRPVVLKRIRQDLASDAELEARFEREARTAARIHHSNVVTVYDRFQYRGAHYIASEFVDGVDLAALVERESPLPWSIAAAIGLEILRGLEAIHAEGTLHRDLKPHNILIGRRGEVKIADFGLAVDLSGSPLTQPGIAVGTPPYMPPEQLRGERVDARVDLFSFGCVLYEMLTGRTPFRMPDEEATDSLLSRIERGRYPRVRTVCRDAPRALVRLVRRCLQPRARRRIASARDARRVLESLLGRSRAADCREQIAAWLWERQVFEQRSNETVVLVAHRGTTAAPRRARWAGAAVALIASLAILGLSLAEPERIVDWTETTVDSLRATAGLEPRPWPPSPLAQSTATPD